MEGLAEEPHKRPFDVERVLARVRDAVRALPKAAMFQLHDEGYRSLFEQVVACILSVRTRDETSAPAARRLFAVARTPEALARLSEAQIDALISDCTFHEPKARQIRRIAQLAVERGGSLPADFDALVELPGVGPKCAGLALGIASGQPRIAVDVHVHRVTNRWGFVHASSPERTLAQLQQQLPPKHWIELNALLVPFGKHVCTGVRPKCSTCPVLAWCRQVGVTSHR